MGIPSIELRKAFRELTILAEGKDYTIPAGETHYLPDKVTDPAKAKGVEVKDYKTKSVHVYGDYALEIEYQISNDRTYTDIAYLKRKTLDVGEDYGDWCHSELGFKYIRVKVRNPDVADHKVKYYCFSVRGL